jgi:hypothetical protein
MATTVICPSCSRKLRLPDDLLGQEVRCPACKKIFATEARSARRSKRDEDEDDDREELDDDPEETDRPSRRGRSDRRNQVPHRGGLLLTLGIGSIVAGVISVPAEFGLGLCTLCCPLGVFAMAAAGVIMVIGLGCGIPAVFMAQSDLRMMEEGTRDPDGRGLTRGGWICAVIGIVLNVLSVVVSVVLIVVYGTALFTAAATAPPPPNQPPVNPPGRRFEVPAGGPRFQDSLPLRRGATGSGRQSHALTSQPYRTGGPNPCESAVTSTGSARPATVL